jgi:hypothetical protein
VGRPVEVNTYDFPDKELGKAVPHGVYDVAANAGWVSVGRSADTAEFAVQTIRRWWHQMGKTAYPNATRLLITADGGGSNGYRVRLSRWPLGLTRLFARTILCPSQSQSVRGRSRWLCAGGRRRRTAYPGCRDAVNPVCVQDGHGRATPVPRSGDRRPSPWLQPARDDGHAESEHVGSTRSCGLFG